MVNFKGLTAKAKQLAQRNPDKVDKVLGQAGNFVDKRTGHKYERHVSTVQQKARQFLGGGRTSGDPTREDRGTGNQSMGDRSTGNQSMGDRSTENQSTGDRAAGEHLGDRPGGPGQPGGPGSPDRSGDVPGAEGPEQGPRH